MTVRVMHVVWVLLLWLSAAIVHGQETPAPPSTTESQANANTQAETAADTFQRLLGDWKALLKQMRDLRTRYRTAKAEEEATLKEQWEALVRTGNDMLPQLKDAALQAYQAAPHQDLDVVRMLIGLAEDYLQRDSYEEVLGIARVMLAEPPDDKRIFALAGRAAFCMNQFEDAETWLKEAQQAGVIDQQGSEFLAAIPEQQTLWQEEFRLREAEDLARQNNDPMRLPEVKLQTTQGDIVLLLFEDQAPETVGNFVSLVEQGFYDGLTFHRVLSGFMAQAGCPKGDGTGGPGYQIYDEFDKPGARKHFRGSLSMAKTDAPNSGGSQFFITFRPTPHLNGKHTVFGRVIDGWEVLAKIQRRNPQDANPPQPDKILKAEVLVKRNHDYAPRKVEQ